MTPRGRWRKPGVNLLTLVDLRERELDAWEKQQLRQAAVKARTANYTKERLIARLIQELRSLGNLRDPATERGGLGLGLSLVKTLVELQGGQLTVKSEGTDRRRCYTVEVALAPKLAHESPRNDQLRSSDSGVMPRYQMPEDDELGIR